MDLLWATAVAALLLLAHAGPAPPKNAKEKAKVSEHPKLILFSFDGFRYDYMTKANTPNLDWLKAGGVSTPYVRPQFPTFTFPNHHSISTGLRAESHGVIANSVWDPELGQSLGAGDEAFWRSRDDIVPLWVLNEWAGDGRISGVQFPNSDFGYGPNRTRPVHYLDYAAARNLTFEDRVDFVIDWLTDETQPANLIFMYFNEPDKAGHNCGPNSVEVQTAIERVDNVTGYFLERLRDLELLDDVNLLFLSDHGMEDVSEEFIIDINSLVDPTLYTYYSTSPVLHIWPNNGEQVDQLYEGFKAGSVAQNFSVYKKEELPERWSYSGSSRIAPIVLVSDPGYGMNEEDYELEPCANDEVKKVWGYHGYDNASPSMRAYFIASGPAFKKGIEIEPFENIDLFPLICLLMDFQPPGHNGTLENVISALLPIT